MEHNSIILTVFIIFAGAAAFSTLALYMRQSLLVAYMLFGVVFGPWGFKAITDFDLVNRVDEIGVVFFMFLLGLQLRPRSLLSVMGKTSWITFTSSAIFFAIEFIVSYWYNYSLAESIVIGSCTMFSSTIASLKLLPTIDSRSQHASEIMISILLLQDLLAILVLLGIAAAKNGLHTSDIFLITSALPIILLFVFLVEHFILSKLFTKFVEFREYMLLVAVAWCLGIAVLAKAVGLSYEIGAFIAGITIAASPIAIYIAEQLNPIRDFFLVLFFFVIGASFDLHYIGIIFIPAMILTTLFMLLKPAVFYFLLRRTNENKDAAWEIGLRLGQLSEFSLLVVFLAFQNKLIGYSVIHLVQAITMLMFIISSYTIVIRYPTRKNQMMLKPVES
jgi:Kef-type K+ transport system membrane component KefB